MDKVIIKHRQIANGGDVDALNAIISMVQLQGGEVLTSPDRQTLIVSTPDVAWLVGWLEKRKESYVRETKEKF